MQVCNGRVACSPHARPFTRALQTYRHIARRASRSEASAARYVFDSVHPPRSTVFVQMLMLLVGICRRIQVRVADGVEQQTESDEDLEKAMEEFLKSQQEKESGGHLLLTPVPNILMD